MNCIILNGSKMAGDSVDLATRKTQQVLRDRGWSVQSFDLRAMQFKHCVGCFNCWLQNPGVCIHRDGAVEVTQAVAMCNLLVLVDPIRFGCYSSRAKSLMERLVPKALPFFRKVNGETHHVLRYPRSPKVVAIGVSDSATEAERLSFRTLVHRNAINFGNPSFVASVLPSAADPDAAIQTLLSEVGV